MKNICVLMVVCILDMYSVHAQSKPDIIIFDEGPPGYYDASYGFASGGSALTLTGPNTPKDKLPIDTVHHYTGSVCGLLQWQSVNAGAWRLFVASPGWAIHDASGYDSLVFFVNGPSTIAAANLPLVGLEDAANNKSSQVPLGTYLTGGVDADTGSWQRVSIPLTDFQPYNTFSLSQLKDVNFAQNAADNVQHTGWFDYVRIITKTDTTRPAAPQNLVSRYGDQSVVLHWDSNTETNLLGYNLYRDTSATGPFSILNSATITSPGCVDLAVNNSTSYYYQVRAVNTSYLEGPASNTVIAVPAPFASDTAFVDYVEHLAVDYFWYEANAVNGIIKDRNTVASAGSIAAMGFGLSAICNGAARGWIPRSAVRDRVLTTLTTLWQKPQGAAASGMIGYKGWFYHWLDMTTATRTWNSELSSVDTGELLAGVLDAREFFDGADLSETQIRALADSLYSRVDWNWMMNNGSTLTMGWYPESGFISNRWLGYNEAMILYIEAIGANTKAVPASAWSQWTSTYNWQVSLFGYDFVVFPPLFGHQTTHCWVDFRTIQDSYMKSKGITYAENTRRATLAQRQYCIQNPGGFTGYGANLWGLTACDGPNFGSYQGYSARGAPPAQNDDGTIAPTASTSSIPFTPDVTISTMRNMYDLYRTSIWTPYGFSDAFNLKANWFDPDVIGFDQGTTALMIENYRTGAVWNRFMKNASIIQGLQRAGFTPVSGVTDNHSTIPRELTLRQNYPNPFNPTTTIEYWIVNHGLVSLKVFDVLGREVATLVRELKQPGQYKETWNANGIASGVYLLRLESGGSTRIIKTLLMK